MNKKLYVFFVAAFVFASRVSAQTFYVDATNGNDLWTGSLPDAQASDGPWRSLAKVSATSLQPGDSVLLKCGAIWHEPLVVLSSGAAGNPITFGKYGANCDASNKPVISGAGTLSGWSVSSGNIYTTQNTLAVVQQNRVVNRHFDLNLASWSFYFPPEDPYPALWVRQENCIAPGNACAKLTGSSGGSGKASLATSNSFTISQGKSYRAKFWLKAELANQNVTAMVRRNGRLINGIKNYDTVGLNQPIVVGTAWQAYEYTFTATSTENQTARIDFQVNAGQTLYIDNVEVMQITSEIADIHQIFVDGMYVKLAQHPNPRSVDPTDTYLAIAQHQTGSVCPKSGGTGTTSLLAGEDLILTADQAQDLVGAGVRIRTNDWLMDDRTIAAYDGNKLLTLSNASTYNLCQGWGYYLDGKPWMLDSADEWHYNRATKQLKIWLPDSGVPNARVEGTIQEFGIDARSVEYVVIDGLRVEKVLTGIVLSKSVNVEIRNSEINNSGESGIVASTASSPIMIDNSIVNSVRNGVVMDDTTNVTLRNNFISNTGTVGSPKKSVGAIRGYQANGATIENNRIQNSGYIGIMFGKGSARILGNYVENSCLVLDDCGAIYVSRNPVGSQTSINGNVVVNAVGNVNGRPLGWASSAQGIYLDDFSTANTVQGNTVVNTDWGIQIHNGFDNFLTQNTVYGVRLTPLQISEDTLTTENTVRNNRVESSLFFPIKADATYRLSGSYGNNDFGTYDLNRYSDLYSSELVNENYKPAGVPVTAKYTLAQWQQTRNHDLNSTSFDLLRLANLRAVSYVGGDLLANSTFDSNVTGWGSYLGIPGSPEWTPACIDGGCLHFEQGAADGHVNTRLSVEASKTYMVRFDVRGGEGQTITVSLRRAGAPYEVVGLSKTIQIGSAWQSYALYAYPKITLAASAAGLHFHVKANESIYLDNVVVQEVAAEINNVADDSAILINTNSVSEAKDCPDAATNPAKCSQYVRFADESPVQWPVMVPAMGSEIVVWSQNPMRDNDRDGVADSNDICLDAPPDNVPVDERGCSFAQRHSANLGILLTDTPDPAVVGGTVNYTVTVTNAGPLAATNVVTSGSLPGCSLGTIPNGGSATCMRTVTANTVGALTQTVSVGATENDSNTANNTATAATAVLDRCAVTVGKNISGTVKRSDGTPSGGVNMLLVRTSTTPQCGNRVTTGSNGGYIFTKISKATYSITPSKTTCANFTPKNRTVSMSTRDISGQNFTEACP